MVRKQFVSILEMTNMPAWPTRPLYNFHNKPIITLRLPACKVRSELSWSLYEYLAPSCNGDRPLPWRFPLPFQSRRFFLNDDTLVGFSSLSQCVVWTCASMDCEQSVNLCSQCTVVRDAIEYRSSRSVFLLNLLNYLCFCWKSFGKFELL